MEFPHLAALSKKIENPDFAMLSVNTRLNQADLARQMVQEHGADWPILLDTKEVTYGLYGVSGVPTTLFIDRDGRTIFKTLGFAEGDEENLEIMVEALLNRPANL
ncbi:MAG: TlpA family protein disulfide reductase [bacterium]|nr:TlpA family protein disulfide reductase [bacterium]